MSDDLIVILISMLMDTFINDSDSISCPHVILYGVSLYFEWSLRPIVGSFHWVNPINFISFMMIRLISKGQCNYRINHIIIHPFCFLKYEDIIYWVYNKKLFKINLL
jgi:hypothetical protein